MDDEEDRRAAVRGSVPAVLTVAVVVGGAVGGGTGTGGPAVLVAVTVAVTVALSGLAALVALLGPRARGRRDEDLAAQWARVEPRWSGRSGAGRPDGISPRRDRSGPVPRPSGPRRPPRPAP